MKTLVSILASIIVISSAQAHPLAQRISVLLGDANVSKAIDETIAAQRAEGAALWFQGIVKSDLQASCIGNRTGFDLLFTKSDREGKISRCRRSVVYGQCGQPLDQVTSVSAHFDCVDETAGEGN